MDEHHSSIDFLFDILILSFLSIASGFVWGFIVGHFL